MGNVASLRYFATWICTQPKCVQYDHKLSTKAPCGVACMCILRRSDVLCIWYRILHNYVEQIIIYLYHYKLCMNNVNALKKDHTNSVAAGHQL